MELNNDKDNSSCSVEVSRRLSCPTTHVKTASIKKKWQVTVIGGSLPRGTEESICSLELLLREVCASLVCGLKI